MEQYGNYRNSLLYELKKQMTGPSYDAWVSSLIIHKLEQELCIAYLGVPDIPGRNTEQIVSILQNRYRDLLEACLAKVLGKPYRVVIRTMTEYDREAADKVQEQQSAGRKNTAESSKLNSQYTFDNFVVGDGNRFAHAAAFAVATSPGEAYNPVYIYGASGMGKTHLLQAIGNHIHEVHPELHIIYVSAENFTNELILAIQKNRTQEFKMKYRHTDVLLIDDVQFFGRTKESQEEFFHTFNDLYQANKQIVISSDCEPEKLDNLQDRLKTRFQWNLIADIQPPAYETRMAILIKRAESLNLPVDENMKAVISFIAEGIKTNVRELEGAFTRVVNYSKLLNEDITPDFARKTLKNIIREEERAVTPEKIKRVVSEYFQVSIRDLESEKRQKNISEARQMGMYLTREMTELALPAIGEAFGGKHHTTVLHACNKIEMQLKQIPAIKENVYFLKEEIKK